MSDIVEHVRLSDTPTATDPRRRYTEAQLEQAIRLAKAEAADENERLRAALERMLLEFDFMVERGVIPDVRNDIIFVESRAALAQGGDK